MSLTDTINYVAERCNCEWPKASKAVHAALGEGALQAVAKELIRDPDQPRHLAGYVDTGLHPVPSKLWAGYYWPAFDRRSQPRGNAKFRQQTADRREIGPVYSSPTIATADIDAWLGPDGGSHKGSADAVKEEKGLIGELYETSEMKPGAFGFKIDLKPIIDRVWRYRRRR